MEINTPIALVCYERALRLPTSSPSKHNQLSDLTYLPEACKTHGTGLAVVQKVPIYKNFGPRQIFWASGFLLWVDTDWRCWCDVCMVHSAPPCLLPRPSFAVCSPLSTHRHTHTPLHLLVLSCTQTKERKRDQRKNQMTCTRLNEGGPGVWHLPQTISSPCCCSLEGFKSAAR